MRYIVSLLVIFSTLQAYGQPDYNSALIPPALRARANAVVRDQEISVDMRTPDNVVHTVKYAITILNKTGAEQSAPLVIFYDKNIQVKSIKGAVLNAMGLPVSRFTHSNFNDESAISNFSLYEDSRVKYFVPPVETYPYTVVYEYEIRYKQNLIVPEWQPNRYSGVAVEKSTYTFLCKTDDEVRIREVNYPGKRMEEVIDKQKKLVWTLANLPAKRMEANSPDPDQYLTSVKIAPVEFTYYQSKGRYTDWNELGRWIYQDLLKNRQALDPATVVMVRNMVKDIPDDKEKARKLYEFMQQKTRYISVQIGIGGFQPTPASEVDKLGYGDCKGLVNYMQSLLAAVNIPSYYTVVYAGGTKKSFEKDFASMDQGNHVILCIPFKNDTTWLECTSQRIPFGHLGDFTDDRTVLACTPEGGKLMHTPALTAAHNKATRTAELELDAEGSLKGKMLTQFEGARYEDHEYITYQSAAERIKTLKNVYNVDRLEFTGIEYEQKKESAPVLLEKLGLHIDRYAAASSGRMFLAINPFNRQAAIPELRERTLPLHINRGYTDEDAFIIKIPSGYVVEQTFVPLTRTTVFGSYSVAIQTEGDTIRFHRKVIVNQGTYRPEDYAAYVSFMNTLRNLDDTRLVLKAR